MTDADEPVFEEPWQAKAFAIAVALHQRGVYTWSEWTEMLGARITTASEADAAGYYSAWLDALQELLVQKGVSTPADTTRWREAWRHAASRTPHGAPIEVRLDDF
jgi:nitrile hydratase accessory protein